MNIQQTDQAYVANTYKRFPVELVSGKGSRVTDSSGKEYVDMGFYIGIGGVVTFKNSKKMKEVVGAVPLERILLETDCPYLAPEPFRGKRNQSSYLLYVAEQIAELKGISAEEVIATTEENARRMYRLDPV